MSAKRYPVCPDSRKCFAQVDCDNFNRCSVLQRVNGKFYAKDGECPFCKPAPREMTNGVLYPYDANYSDERN